MVSGEVVEMTDEKVETLKKIEPVKTLKDAQYLLGFANFYRRCKDVATILLWKTPPGGRVRVYG